MNICEICGFESVVFRGGIASDTEIYLRSSNRYYSYTTIENGYIGFRVAAIPEPSSIMLMGVAGGCELFIRRRLMV